MSAFESVGLILAVGDAVAQLLIGIRLGRDADQKVTAVITTSETRLKRICDTTGKYSESADLTLLPPQVLQRIIDDLTQIKNELAAFQHRLICMFKVQSFLSSDEMASTLSASLERLRPLENFLDVNGIMPYAHATLAGRFRQVTALVHAAAHADDFEAAMQKLHQMVAVLQVSDDAQDDAAVRDFTDMLAKGGIDVDTRNTICARVRELWGAWKLQPLDITPWKKKSGEYHALGDGVVYKASLTPRDRFGKQAGEQLLVAVKDLRIRRQDLTARLPDVVREIFLQMDMDHPCVLKTYGGYWPNPPRENAESDDEDDDDGARYTPPFIVMERMTYNLAKAVRKGLIPDAEKQRVILHDVARGVAHLHQNHVVHRDLKPENVLLRVVDGVIVGHAKVGDFGVSRRVQIAQFQQRHKRAGVALGTFAFMPPEVARDVDAAPSKRSWDIWSFGVLCCHVVAPDSVEQLRSLQPGRLQKMAETGELVRMMNEIIAELPNPEIRAVAQACLAEDADARPTIAQVVRMLRKEGDDEDEHEEETPGENVQDAQVAPLDDVMKQEPKWLGVDGVEPRLSQPGLKFYREPAEAGLSNGQRVRDMFYKYGASLVKDMKSAIAVCSAAASAGIPYAKVQLGFMHETGIGVPKDVNRAVRLYRAASNFGNSAGKTHLGECYQLGIGVEKDIARAVRLYTSASNVGHNPARNNLAYCYWNGLGVEKDEGKAAALYAKSAEHGSSAAQSDLGYCYLHGIGVPKDKVKAVGSFASAAEARDPTGQFNLGRCYEYGIGVTPDIAKALCLYTKAGDDGSSSGLVNQGCIYVEGNGVAKNVGKAVTLFKKAADAGSAAGKYNLGLCYEKGLGVMQDTAKARRYFEKAARSEKPLFMFKLGSCFLHGIGAPKDTKRAVSVFTRAVNGGDHNATNSLGYCYLRGEGVPADPANAMLLFKAAMAAGNISALSNLGYCYQVGVGVDKADAEKATDLYSSAAAYGDPAGQYHMGYCYLHGAGVPRDVSMAMKLYAGAADGGDSAAQNNLAYCHLRGDSVDKDEARAAELFAFASEQGNVFAQINLANCYLHAIGVKKDAQRSVRLYTAAACAGNAFAQNMLAQCYEAGEGVPQSADKAWTLYRSAAAAGSSAAKANLARFQRLHS